MTEDTRIIVGGDLPEHIKSSIIRDMRRILETEGIHARMPEQTEEAGSRGGGLLCELIVPLLTGGGMVVLGECFKNVVTRDRKVKIEVRNAAGAAVSVTADNVADPAVQAALRSLAAVLPQ